MTRVLAALVGVAALVSVAPAPAGGKPDPRKRLLLYEVQAANFARAQRFDDAVEKATLALELRARLDGETSVSWVRGAVLLARLHIHAGDYEEARALLDRGRAIARREEHRHQLGEVLMLLGRVDEETGHLDAAAKLYRRAVRLHAKGARRLLIGVEAARGNHRAAGRQAARRDEARGRYSGGTGRDQGRDELVGAMRRRRAELDLHIEVLGEEHVETADALVALADALIALAERDDADETDTELAGDAPSEGAVLALLEDDPEELLRRALAIRERLLGSEHPSVTELRARVTEPDSTAAKPDSTVAEPGSAAARIEPADDAEMPASLPAPPGRERSPRGCGCRAGDSSASDLVALLALAVLFALRGRVRATR